MNVNFGDDQEHAWNDASDSGHNWSKSTPTDKDHTLWLPLSRA